MYYANNDLLCVILIALIVAGLYLAYKLGEQEGYKKAMDIRVRRKMSYNQLAKRR